MKPFHSLRREPLRGGACPDPVLPASAAPAAPPRHRSNRSTNVVVLPLT
jgi:hypothetical protein